MATQAVPTGYKEHIDEIMVSRFRFFVPIGIVLHLAFSFIDYHVYPSEFYTFLKVRMIDAGLVFIFYLLSFADEVKPYIVWLVDIVGTIMVIGMSYMIYITDGTASRFYEGVNLVFLGMGFLNPFYTKHNILTFIIQLAIYETAMLLSPSHFDRINFYYANYFMPTVAFFVVLLTKFYQDQHFQAFVHQEKLKLSEKKLASLYSQADKLSKTDELTEINNRRYFFEMLSKKIELSEATNVSFYLVIFDVDHFKEINDRYGHSFGDAVLIKVVETVKSHIRSSDFFARYGGDEFILYMDQLDREAIILRLAMISNAVKQLNLNYKGQPVHISISIGAAEFKPGQNIKEEKLMEIADTELFNVKKVARGGVRVAE